MPTASCPKRSPPQPQRPAAPPACWRWKTWRCSADPDEPAFPKSSGLSAVVLSFNPAARWLIGHERSGLHAPGSIATVFPPTVIARRPQADVAIHAQVRPEWIAPVDRGGLPTSRRRLRG